MTTSSKIRKHIFNLSPSKATGLDGLSAKLLKVSADIIAPQISAICNTSITTGVFPKEWKQAKVIPLFKSGDSNIFTNYRPISVLPVLSKILERHVHDSLYAYLQKYHMLIDSQSGFRKYHSCETAIAKLTNDMLNAIDSGQIIGLLLIDLRKAFDLVDHEILLEKLRIYGSSDMSSSWFQSYLSHRTQCVTFNGVVSEPQSLCIGVPQGSILGPLFFILFMNDIVLEIEDGTRFDMYADDSSQYYAGQSVDEVSNHLNEQIKPVTNWISANSMALNVEKTETMIMHAKHRKLDISTYNLNINGKEIKVVNSHKLLGHHIDNKFLWNIHVNKLCSKLQSRLFLLKKIKHLLPRSARITFFDGLVLPLIDFGCIMWTKTTKDNLKRIHKIMKQFARAILEIKCAKDLSTMDLFKTLDWLPIDARADYFTGVLVFKSLNGLAPDYMSKMFKLVSSVHNRKTRQSTRNLLFEPRAKTKYGQMSFSYIGARLWNNIPDHIRRLDKLDNFKVQYLKYCKDLAFKDSKFNLDL